MKVNSINLRTLRNILPALSAGLKEDAFVQVVDVTTNAHYRRGEGGTVTLGGDTWGTLNDLLNLTVVDCELDSPFYPSNLTVWVQK